MPTVVNPRLINWASDIDAGTIRQAEQTARLPVVAGHVALMPDAHFGTGSTVGSVIPTESAIIPAAVGVDIGCGMIATELTLRASDLPDDLASFMPIVEKVVPAGVGQGHEHSSRAAEVWFRANPCPDELSTEQNRKVLGQFGSLGGGNHFFEVCLDERDVVWLVLHSGSRGIGNQLAQAHIRKARKLAKQLEIRLEDPDLAYFTDDQPEFQAYIAMMLWAQDYAFHNRAQMASASTAGFLKFVGSGRVERSINCHHNFTQLEQHPIMLAEQRVDIAPPAVWTDSQRRPVWITRKGAIKADIGDFGVIPGSMGARSFIVEGLGNPLSYNSCSHGAGRRMSRGEAKRTYSADDLRKQMVGKVWLERKARDLIDEIPSSYKDIDAVMADQKDLVAVRHTLHQILNFKGTK